MLRLFLVMLALCLLSNSAWTQTCTDVKRFDFRNATIPIGSPDENELKTLFNEPNPGPFSLRMRRGVAFISDDGGSSQDWRAELLVDRIVHPDPSTWIRVLVIENDHLTGTGTWRYVMAFNCEKGSLIMLFQFSSEGVALKHLGNGELRLYQAIWASTDSHASASKHREVFYRWNAQKHRYRRVNASILSDGAKSVADQK